MTQSHIAAFDLDRTIVCGNFSFRFCRFLVSKKVLPRLALLYSFFNYIRHLFFGMDLIDLHKAIFVRLLKGRSLSKIQENIEPFLREYFFPNIYPPAFSHLRLAQHLGHYTIILSNSPSFLVNKISEMLGVDECRSTEYAVDFENNLSEVLSVFQGEHKASSLQEIADKFKIKKTNISAYTDSILDLPLLSVAGYPYAVNPDRKLEKISKQNKWEIL